MSSTGSHERRTARPPGWRVHPGVAWPLIVVLHVSAASSASVTSDLSHQQAAGVPVLERYASGEFEPALEELRTTRAPIRTFITIASEWVRDGDSPDHVRRLTAVMAIAVELLAAAVDGTAQEYGEARVLVEWVCDLMRGRPPLQAERLFHQSAIALLQAAGDDELLVGARLTHAVPYGEPRQPHVRHAAERFPDEPRFRLAWATTHPPAQKIAGWPLSASWLADNLSRDADARESAGRIQDALDLLGRLIDDPTVGSEARLRRGVLTFLQGRPETAQTDLALAARSTDPFVHHLANVMLGLIAERGGRLEDAIDRYAAARKAVPATTATLVLAAALSRAGRSAEAEKIVSHWSQQPRPPDPWWLYGLRDYRLVPGYLERMRAITR
jgi:tetratricopeptide (TPR) repeat protein